MNNIGIIAASSIGGLHEIFTQNNEGWEIAIDARNLVKCVETLGDSSFIHVLRFYRQGVSLTIIKPLSASEYVEAIILIPRGLDVPGSELENAICVCEQAISAEEPETERLESLCQIQYEGKPSAMLTSKAEASPAVLYYGDGSIMKYSLLDILNSVCQPQYSEYSAVFLADKASGLSVSRAVDISSQRIKDYVLFNVPAGIPAGAMVEMDGKPFLKPVYAAKGAKKNLSIKRTGYKSIDYQCVVGQDNQPPQDIEWERSIKPSDFAVLDSKTGERIVNFVLTINGHEVATEFTMPEKAASQLNVKISAPGYSALERTMNLEFKPAPVNLTREKVTKNYVIDGIPFYSDHEGLDRIEGSPIKGYILKKGNFSATTLVYLPWLVGVVGLAVGLLVGIAIGWMVWASPSPEGTPRAAADTLAVVASTEKQDAPATDETKVEEQKAEEQKAEEQKAEEQKAEESKKEEQKPAEPKKEDNKAEAKAYECLSYAKWREAEIEKVPELHGLYDDVANHRASALTGKWAAAIDATANPQWGKILKAVKNYPVSKPFTWGVDATRTITVDNYVAKLKQKSQEEKNQ